MDSGSEMSRGGKYEETGGKEERRWEDLTKEALVEVFTRVDFEDKYRNVALVCKAWRRAVMEAACWVEVDIDSSFEKRKETAIWWTTEFETRMESMIMTVVDWGSSHLRQLRTRHCSDKALQCIAQRCPNLRLLHIQMSQNVTNESMTRLASICPKLESVDLSECRSVSAETLSKLGEHCKGLTELKRNMREIDGNCRMRSFGIPQRILQLVPMGDQEANVISKCMPQLKRLEMRNSTVHDQCLLLLAENCTELEFLDLCGCSYLTGRGLDEAQQKLPPLILFKKPILPERNLQFERYGHWQLFDNRFSHQYLEF
ncbi:unnamed protein product [Calypogeia fissa]